MKNYTYLYKDGDVKHTDVLDQNELTAALVVIDSKNSKYIKNRFGSTEGKPKDSLNHMDHWWYIEK
jgi:hypothetical protein